MRCPVQAQRGQAQQASGQRICVPVTTECAANRRLHVRNALARFDQVDGVTEADREQAFANIKAAAKHYDVEVAEDNWKQLGDRPHTKDPAQ